MSLIRGVQTGFKRGRMWPPKRMQPQRNISSPEWDEPSASLVTADGDYIQNLSTTLADCTRFLFMIRCEMTQDTASSYFWRLQHSSNFSQMLIGRINGGSGNKIAVTLIDDDGDLRQIISDKPFRSSDGFKTILVYGNNSGAIDTISIWIEDEKVAEVPWAAGGWDSTSVLNFGTNALPVEQAYVGRENGTTTRSDMNLRRVVYWNTAPGNPESLTFRRTLFDDTGEIVSTVPGTPEYDVQGTYGALWNNVAGSLGNMGLVGTVTYQDQSKKRMKVGNDGTQFGYMDGSYGDLAALWLDDQFNGVDIERLTFRSNDEVRLAMTGAIQQSGVTTVNVTLPSDYAGVQAQPMALAWDAPSLNYNLTVNADVREYIESKDGEYITLTVDPV